MLSSFGSIISISGPLLPYPTLLTLCPTPILIAHRPPPIENALPGSFETTGGGFVGSQYWLGQLNSQGFPCLNRVVVIFSLLNIAFSLFQHQHLSVRSVFHSKPSLEISFHNLILN